MPDGLELAPVDHNPFGDGQLKFTSVGYDPFAAEKFANPAVQSALTALATLPKRAIQNSQYALDSGTYDPGPTLEAATLPMGTGAIAGVPVKGTEAVLGAGPIRAYHASPSDFNAFDVSKVGTGIGHNYNGQGLYFAEKPGYAEGVRNTYFPQGKVYETDLKVQPHEMFDLDAPAKNISPAMMQAAKDAGAEFDRFIHLKKGRDVLNSLEDVSVPDWRKYLNADVATNQEGATRFLQSQGFKGNTYSDSFGKHHVVFDDKLIDIVKKYAAAGIALPPAIAAAYEQQYGSQNGSP